MGRILSIRDYEKAAAATSFEDLWRSLCNDELFELGSLFKRVTGRALAPSFHGATQKDWAAMRRVLQHLEKFALRVNRLFGTAGWSDGELRTSLLDRAEAEDQSANEDSEYLALAHKLYDGLRNEVYFGGAGQSFRNHGLFELKSVPVMPRLDEQFYDIFISYKTARHADDAQRLADRLIATRQYSVWFDRYILNSIEDRPDIFEAEHLLAILRNAVSHCTCSIIFEGVLSAGAFGPETEEVLIAKRKLMLVNNAAVIWDWHGIEIMVTEWGITIHPKMITAFHQEGGVVKWSKAHAYEDENERDIAIDAALRAVAETRATRGIK